MTTKDGTIPGSTSKRNECFFTGKLQSLTSYQTQAGEGRTQMLLMIPAEDEFSYPTRIVVRTSAARGKHFTPMVNQVVSLRAYAVTVIRQNNGKEYDSTSLYEIEG